MGCCASKPHEEPLLPQGPPRDVSTTDVRALDGKQMPGGCKLWPFVASCPASYPYRAHTRVVEQDTHVFAALFTGVGGHQAAEHCISNCYEVFTKALQQAEPDRALRQTVQQLEASYFALQNLSDQVKALVGAVGTLLYLHTPSNQVYVANIGNAAPFLTRSTGSFSSIKVTAQLLTSDAKHRHPLSWHHAVLTGEPDPSSAAAAAAAAAGGGQGPTDARCIGMGYGKVPALAAAWAKALGDTPRGLPPLPFIRTDCEVTVSPLSPGDEALVLGSADLVGLVPPREVATLMHYFSAGVLHMLQDTYLPDRPAVVLPEEVVSQGDASAQSGATSIQPGGMMLAHARGKALQRYNTSHRARLGHSNLRALSLEVADAPGQDLAPPEEEGSGGAGGGGAGRPGSKRAVHGDMAAMVICLQWPRSAGGADVTTGGGSSHALVAKLARSPRAAYRWQLVRALVRFQVARRRQLLGSWWEAVERVAREAEMVARQREVEAWRRSGTAVQVSRTGQLSAAAANTSSTSSPWHGKYTPSSAQKTPPTARAALAGSTAAASTAGISGGGWGGSPGAASSSMGGGGGHKASHHGLRRTGTAAAAAAASAGGVGCSSGRSTPVGHVSSAASTPTAGSGLRRTPGVAGGSREAGAMAEGYLPVAAAGAGEWEVEPATPVPAAAAYAGEGVRQRDVVLEEGSGRGAAVSSGRVYQQVEEEEGREGYTEEEEEAAGAMGLADRSPDASKGRLRDVPGAAAGSASAAAKQVAATGRGALSSGSSPATASRLGSAGAASGGSKMGPAGSPVKRPAGVGTAGRRAAASTGAGGSPTKRSSISLRRQH